MRAGLIVIGKIRGQGSPQMPLAENENVIQTVAPKRSDQPFSIGILPWRARGDGSVTNAHTPCSAPEYLPVSTVIVAHQIARSCVPGKCLHDLSGQPVPTVNQIRTYW